MIGIRFVSAGHAVFAAIMIVVGLLGFTGGDFAPIWWPVPKTAPAREMLIFATAVVSLACGAGLVFERTAALAARLLLLALLGWWVAFRVPVVLAMPTIPVVYENIGETTVSVAGAWVLYVWFATAWEKQSLGVAAGDTGLGIARVLYGLAMIAFGVAHFAYVTQTAALVPQYLPSPLTWAYLTGGFYVAAGVAVLTGVLARLAAALSALQMGLFSLLVWVPLVAAGVNEGQWREFVVSWALTAGGWVVAESYRGASWFSLRPRSA